MESVLIITNNKLLVENYKNSIYVVKYSDTDVMTILELVRDYIHRGAVLLTHPLSGSVKPNENPYKSIAIKFKSESQLDLDSLEIIENSIRTVKKFLDIGVRFSGDDEKKDYELIDLTLINSALCR